MTRGTYRQVLLATGLAFCALPTLGVNPAAATHPIGIVAPADEAESGNEGGSSSPVGNVADQVGGLIGQAAPASD